MIRNFVKSNLRMGDHRDVTLAAWLLIALGCGFVAYIARMHEVTHDAFHEMSLVREALENHAFPTRDSFAYTPTVEPVVHHEWATGAVLYFVTVGTGLGATGLTVLKFLLAAGLWLMLYRVARLRGAHPYLLALFSFVVFPVLWVGFATVRAAVHVVVYCHPVMDAGVGLAWQEGVDSTVAGDVGGLAQPTRRVRGGSRHDRLP